MVRQARQDYDYGDEVDTTKLRIHRTVLKDDQIRFLDEPIELPLPGEGGEGELIVEKENGRVKGFRYRCACGHEDHFVCE